LEEWKREIEYGVIRRKSEEDEKGERTINDKKRRNKRKGSKSRERNIQSQQQEQQPFWSCILRCCR